MRTRLPGGVDDFRELVDPSQNYLFIDKTEMIHTVIDDPNKAILITRPRRWGKSLNFSMLQYFFAAEVNGQSTQGMFNNLMIASLEGGRYMQEQGKYPVIFITFKNAKAASFELAMNKIKLLLCSLFKQHRYLLESDKLASDDVRKFSKYINEEITDQSDLEDSLRFLSECLFKHTGQKVYVLIDEYDSPVMGAYYEDESLANDHFVHLITLFMRSFLGAGLKGNPYLKKGLMTGILRISHNEMLSGLNNLDVKGILDDERFNWFYGFTEDEVKALFEQAGQSAGQLELAKAMYNGYEVGGVTLYNPWSVNKYLDSSVLDSYWVYSGSDRLIKLHAIEGGESIKGQFSDLLLGKSIKVKINKYIDFETLKVGQEGMWMMMLYAGYLKTRTVEREGGTYLCELVIPNEEVKGVFQNIFSSWLSEAYPVDYRIFIEAIAQGDIERFVVKLNQLMQGSSSVKDFVTENSYHMFVFGLISSLMDTHRILSNKESAAGFFDVLIIPDPNKAFKHSPATLLEFKHIKPEEVKQKYKRKVKDLTEAERVETLKIGTEEGMVQADRRNYKAELLNHPHVGNLVKAGVAFLGKASGAYFQKIELSPYCEQPRQEIFPSVSRLLEETREAKKPKYGPGLMSAPRPQQDNDDEKSSSSSEDSSPSDGP